MSTPKSIVSGHVAESCSPAIAPFHERKNRDHVIVVAAHAQWPYHDISRDAYHIVIYGVLESPGVQL